MKNLITLICFSFLCQLTFLTAQNTDIAVKTKSVHKTHYTVKKSTPTQQVSTIHFATNKIDFGTIKEDAVIEKSFEFTNTGKNDLVIIDATGSCGCTLPSIPSMPIPPGGTNKIMVKYTAKNKVGPQKPLITVVTNGTPSVIKLQLEGWVEQIPGGMN